MKKMIKRIRDRWEFLKWAYAHRLEQSTKVDPLKAVVQKPVQTMQFKTTFALDQCRKESYATPKLTAKGRLFRQAMEAMKERLPENVIKVETFADTELYTLNIDVIIPEEKTT